MLCIYNLQSTILWSDFCEGTIVAQEQMSDPIFCPQVTNETLDGDQSRVPSKPENTVVFLIDSFARVLSPIAFLSFNLLYWLAL